MQLSFSASTVDAAVIKQIVDRAWQVSKDARAGVKKLDFMMDLTAAHCNGCPLDLDDLLHAPHFDFVHDVFGIYRHLNRETGKLEDCFVPRCAMRQH